ncbi:methyltransferase [Amycolatopsis nigrescens]|uniref:methyltransferase n=1 Tax=Amycolatopsis nigrescens TaxID=381445 RepID=UPI000378626D|nr:methyltransferase [Amycolatopsis nigrescens]
MKVDLQATREALEVITGGWRAQALYTAVKLGLPDHIEAGRVTTVELAASTGSKEEGIHRLMRLLVAMKVFEGDGETGFRNTALSRTLLDEPDSMREMCLLYGEEFYTAWGHPKKAITTVGSGFEEAYGQPLYSYLGEHEDAADRFQRAMKAGNVFFDYVPDVFDFSGKKVVDVGGGNGQLLAAILSATPDATGILFDREHVVPLARENLTATVGLDRVELAGGSMFESVPPGGDVYMFCRVLAGWADDDVVGVFERCRRELPADGRVLVFDRLVRATADAEATVLPSMWDLHLLMTAGGKHRTLESFTSMLNRAGFDVERTADLPLENTAIIAKPRH